MIALSLALAMSVQAAAGSAPAIYERTDNWTIYRNERDCSAVGPLTLGYDYRLGKVVLRFVDSAVRGLKPYDRRELTIVLIRHKDKTDDVWGKRAFLAEKASDRDGTAFRLELDDEILTDLGRSGRVELRSESGARSFSMVGASHAIASLRLCARGLVPKRQREW